MAGAGAGIREVCARKQSALRRTTSVSHRGVMSDPSTRVAIIGLGRWGMSLYRVFASTPRCRVVAVCDNRAQPRDSFQGTAPVFSEFDQLLKLTQVDCIVIATQPEFHARLAISALNAGKHVFVEKPMAMCEDDAIQVAECGRRAGRLLMVGHVLQYDSTMRETREMFGTGPLGPALSATSERSGREVFSTASEALWALAPHDISFFLRLFRGEVLNVRAASGARTAQLHVEFDCGGTSQTVVHFDPAPRRRIFSVEGASGSARIEERGGKTTLQIRAQDLSLDRAIPLTHPLQTEVGCFVDAVLDGAPVPTDAAEGLRVVRVIDAAVRALNGS